MTGSITLVGAGPGDEGLLTAKGRQALLSADVVIYDRLVGKDILDIIPQGTEKIDVGKESSNHKVPQSQINVIMVEKAKQGKNVVRLKGGDCFLFGRGGEELSLPVEMGIPFKVIPGITSALAVPAYAGIPVTHRDFASSVHIFTGHKRENLPLDIDFEGCVRVGGTLVFLMGVSSLPLIAQGLISAGMDKDMPVCVIESGTTPCQRKVFAPLCQIAERAAEEKVKSPAVIVVGRVCSLNEKLDWFDALPLKGVCVVVTRPAERTGTLSARLKGLGAQVLQLPCIKTVSLLDKNTANLAAELINKYDWAVFTSPSGVKTMFDGLFANGFDARIFGGVKIAVIGRGTGEQLAEYGLRADLMPPTYDGKSLGQELSKKAAGQRVLLLRAEKGSVEITEALHKAGIEYKDMPIYKTIYIQNDGSLIQQKINEGKVDFVTFTSASTVHGFAAAVKGGYDSFKGLCIGEKTAQAAEKYGIKTVVSHNATIDDMVAALVREIEACRQKL